MPAFGAKSLAKLSTCDDRLQRVFKKVVERFDCTILEGHRTEAEQNEAVEANRSKTPWPQSKHNSLPSKAIDAAPYPIDWNDRERFSLFAGYVIGVADGMGIKLRWGGDWDRDTQVSDNDFDDLDHFEVVE